MNRASKPENTTQSQSERFEQAARELGVDLDEEKLKEALRKLGQERPDPKHKIKDK